MSVLEANAGEAGEATRAMMPGLVAETPIDADTALLLGLTLARLRRVRTDPGSGDRAFLYAAARIDPAAMTARQRAHVIRLAWRYRIQLPPMLRPGADPNKQSANDEGAS